MKRYVVREEMPKEARKSLAQYPEFMQDLLYARGIFDSIVAEKFLHPRYEDLHDPFLLKDMDKVVERVRKAVINNEKIVIYSDYDADGIPGAVVLHDYFKEIGYTNFTNYIPHRHTEGFGLNHEAIIGFAADGVKLLISIDCGIADVAEVSRAQEAGIDMIITDHHLPPDPLPKAFAILNPKQPGCEYPEKMLCGSGVIFKLVQALGASEPTGTMMKAGREKWLLDMVGMATLSDMVPLTGENRILAHFGLLVLRKTPRPGLSHLLSQLKIAKQHLTEDDVGFMITPRINAASRLGVPMDAFNMLSTRDEAEAGFSAAKLEAVNTERKATVATLVKEIKREMKERELKNVIVMGNPLWRPSLLGLVANSLAEEYNRPVFLWGRDGDGEIKGSCRSGGTVSVVRLMEGARSHFAEFGGHDYSGGFSVTAEKIHFLESALVESFDVFAKIEDEIPATFVDKKMSLDDVTMRTWNHIALLAPFGVGNPKPLFLFENVTPSKVKQFGKTKEHLELSFMASQGPVRAISFFNDPESYTCPIREGVPLNLIATLEQSFFMNRPELRLRIVDVI